MKQPSSPGQVLVRGSGCGALAGCLLGSLPFLAMVGLFLWILVSASNQSVPLGIEGEQIVGLLLALPPLWLLSVGGGMAIGVLIGAGVSLLFLIASGWLEPGSDSLRRFVRLGSPLVGLALASPAFVVLFLIPVLALRDWTAETMLAWFLLIVLVPVAAWTLIGFLIGRNVSYAYMSR